MADEIAEARGDASEYRSIYRPGWEVYMSYRDMGTVRFGAHRAGRAEKKMGPFQPGD